MGNYSIAELLYSIPATLIAIVFHETAHAWVSYLCGDKMVKADGRLSLNPLKHLDLMGTLCLLLFHFGWAKPVMVNTASYKHKRLDFCLVALAGPLMNFITAFVALLIQMPVYYNMSSGTARTVLFYFLMYTAYLNIGLGVFNLIPIPPLDGSNVLLTILPPSAAAGFAKIRKYSSIILLIAIFVLANIFGEQLGWVNYGIYSGMQQGAYTLLKPLLHVTASGSYI